jgi:hypothetical protein
MEGLGRLFDLGPGIVPVDLSGGAATGKRINMQGGTGVTFVVFKGLESAGTDDPVLTFQEHQVESGGSPKTLPVPHWYYKALAALAGTESWKKVFNTSDGTDPALGTGTVNSTLTLIDGTTHLAPLQAIAAVEISANHLDDGYSYLSVNTADAGATAQIGGILAILHDLTVKRDPTNMRPTLY